MLTLLQKSLLYFKKYRTLTLYCKGFFFHYICNMITDFTSLSDEAKIWIYPSSRKFYTNEIEEIDTKIKAFVESWKKEAQDFKCSYQFL